MKSTIKKRTFKAIYRLLNMASPVDFDCGTLCSAACCSCEKELNSDSAEDYDYGIYLLTGEDKIFSKNESWLGWGTMQAEDFEFPESWHGKVYFLNCKTAPNCDREMRPIQCRTFPLAPHIDDDGELCLIYHSSELPYECPLIGNKLNDDFIKATFTVWKHLIEDPLIYDLVELDSEIREDYGEKINIVYKQKR